MAGITSILDQKYGSNNSQPNLSGNNPAVGGNRGGGITYQLDSLSNQKKTQVTPVAPIIQQTQPKQDLNLWQNISRGFIYGLKKVPGQLADTAGIISSKIADTFKPDPIGIIQSIPDGKGGYKEVGMNTPEFRNYLKSTGNAKVLTQYDQGMRQLEKNRQVTEKAFSTSATKIKGYAENVFNDAETYKKVNLPVEEPKKFSEAIRDPKWIARSLAENAPSMLTSLGISVVTAAATKNPGVALSLGFASSFGQNASEAYRDAKAYGLDDKKAENVGLMVGSANGLLDTIPFGRIINRMPEGDMIKKQVLKEVTKSIIKQGLEEGGTESLQQIISNAVAKTYDENRSLFAGVPESAFIGGIMGSGTGAVSDVAISVNTPTTITAPIVENVTQKVSSKIDEIKAKPAESLSVEDKSLLDAVTSVEKGEPIFQKVENLNDKAGKYETADEFAQGEFGTSKNASVGLMTPESIKVNPQNVDMSQVQDYILRMSQTKEITPVYVEKQGDNLVTKDDYKVVAYTVTKKPMPTVVTNSKIEGFPTIEELYTEAKAKAPKVEAKPVEPTNQTLETLKKKQQAFKTLRDANPGDEKVATTLANIEAKIKTITEALAQEKPRETSVTKRLNEIMEKQKRGEQIVKQTVVKQDTEGERYKNVPDKKVLQQKDFNGGSPYKGIKPENIVHFNQGSNERVTLIVPEKDKVLIEAGALYDKLIKGKLSGSERTRGWENWKSKVEYIASTRNISKQEADKLIIDTHKTYKAIAKENAMPNNQVILNLVPKSPDNTVNTDTKTNNQTTDIPVPSKNVKIDQLIDAEGDKLSETVDKIPVGEEKSYTKGAIDVVKTDDGYMVLDGQHRAVLAMNSGKTDIEANILTSKEALNKYGDTIPTLESVLPEDTNTIETKPATVTNTKTKETAAKVDVKVENTYENPAQNPIGTGKREKSTAYTRVFDRLSEETRQDVSYNRLNLEQDANNASDFIADNPEQALRVAFGYEDPPNGMTETAIAIALADKAEREGKYRLQSQLEASRSLRQTRRGQEIVSERGRFNDNSPYTFIKDLLDRRLTSLGRNTKEEILAVFNKENSPKKQAVKRIDKQVEKLSKIVKREQSKIALAQSIIDSLRC